MHVGLSPRPQGVEDGSEGLSQRRKQILDLWRYLGIHGSHHQAIRLQFAKLSREHTLCQAMNPSPDLVEANQAIQQMEKDDALPFAVDQAECRLHRTARDA